jgi:hypothetical protein
MKPYKKAFVALVLPCLLAFNLPCLAQRSDKPVSSEEQKQTIDKAFTLLKANYIFPDVIPVMEKEVYRKLTAGEYTKLSTAEEFIRGLNNDLETLSKDRHIDIFFDPIRVKQIMAEEKGDQKKPAYAPEFLQRAKYENYMVRKVERLDGNVGYLKFNAFVDTVLSRKTLMAAMNLVANSEALVIDLRQNGGGDAKTLAFLLSYFLPDSTLISKGRSRSSASLILNYSRKDPSITVFRKDMPVYVLVSKRTSSAAEAFAYTLQSYKRAVIIGEVTNGEANPGYLFPVSSEMYIMIPAFENINPITKTNWQGKGVLPDILIQSDKALVAAQANAYQALAESSSNTELKAMYEWMSIGMNAELKPLALPESELKLLQGEFADNRHVTLVNGALYYYRGENPENRKKLIPLTTDLFGLEGLPYFRLRFVKNDKNELVAVEGLYDDGKKETSKKL